MRSTALLFLLLLCGCMVGPNYRRPLVPVPEAYCEGVPEEMCMATSETFLEWWHRFEDPLLDELLSLTARQNYDLRLAIEKVCQARANLKIATANLFPELDLEVFASRSRNSKNLGSITSQLSPLFQNFYLVGVNIAWTLDVFGGLKRAERAKLFAWQSAAENARYAQIIALSEVATQYTLIRALQKKVILAQEIVEFDREELSLITERMNVGFATEIDVMTQRAILDTNGAEMKNLEILYKQSIYALAPLIGMLPETLCNLFDEVGSIPNASGKVPALLPSELLCRRPDIRAAERNLASATEEIGVAVANLFPQFSLTSSNLFGSRLNSSNVGFASSSVSNLFSNLSQTWSFGLEMFLPLVDFGRRVGQVRVETSLQRQALITYEKTVTVAFKEVEVALASYFEEEWRQQFLIDEAASTKRAGELITTQYEAGLADFSQVLEARKRWLIAESALTDSQQALANDLIAIYQSLGGEWACFYTP